MSSYGSASTLIKTLRIDHRSMALRVIGLDEDCIRSVPSTIWPTGLVGNFKGVIGMVKQSLFGAVAIVAFASSAGAADMQPVLKAPAAVDQQATGYVEVYSGWASTRQTNDGDS